MPSDHLDALRAEVERVALVGSSVDHDARLGHLPGWTVHDVLAHLVGDVVWVHDTVRTGVVSKAGIVASDQVGDALLHEWLDRAGGLLHDLAARDPAESCPNFAHGSAGTIGWQIRHTAHEVMIHRWDIESIGTDHAPIAADTAIDAIDELFETYAVRYSPHVLDGPIVIASPDHDVAWCVAPAARAGFVDVERAAAPAVADVAGSPSDLLLLLWNRMPIGHQRFVLGGDADRVAGFLAGPVTA